MDGSDPRNDPKYSKVRQSMHAIVTKILVQVLDSKIYIRQKRVLELAMTRAGRAVGWKSRGLAKDSEGVGGKRGA